MRFWCILRCAILISVVINMIMTSNLPNLILTKASGTYYCTLYNDSSHSAIAWDLDERFPDSRYMWPYRSPYGDCTINRDQFCTLKQDDWIVKNEFTDFPPVLNELWKEFRPLPFQSIDQRLSDSDDFRFSFSLKASEVHIIFWDGFVNCYYVTLSNEKRIYTYKCDLETIPLVEEISLTENCSLLQTAFVNTTVVNLKEWHHLSVVKEGNSYSVWKYGRNQAIMTFTANSSSSFVPTYVFLRNPNDNGAVVVHKLDVFAFNSSSAAQLELEGRTTCLAFFVKACENCAVEIAASDRDGNVLSITRANQSTDLQQINVKMDKESDTINVEIKVVSRDDTDQNWYLSNKILSCKDIQELRAFRHGCCHALRYPEHKICWDQLNKYNPRDWKCPPDTIGKNCIPCYRMAHGCRDVSKVCDVTSAGVQCSCLHGFHGTKCDQSCSAGSYGFDCRQKCGKCNNSCDYITGICNAGGCESNYWGAYCTELGAITKSAPIVTSKNSTSATIFINGEYEGNILPKRIIIEVKQPNQDDWQHSGEFSYEPYTQEIVIRDLRPNITYEVRAIFVSDKLAYRGPEVRTTTFTTACASIHAADLAISTTNSAIQLSIVNPKLMCLFGVYQFRTYIGRITHFRAPLGKVNMATYLTAHSNYTVAILDENGVIAFKRNIITDEDAPGLVISPYISQIGDRNVTIEWYKPLYPNGIIRNYIIEYWLVKHIGCDNRNHPYIRRNITTNDTKIVICDLHPHSMYFAEIRAVTKYEGKPEEILFETISSNLTEEDVPMVNFIESIGRLTVELISECRKETGPRQFSLCLICVSAWCSGEQAARGNSWFRRNEARESTTFEVLPYTEYRLELNISRDGYPALTKHWFHTTKPGVPGKVLNLTVHSTNETAASLRWLPPYPPTGKVSAYKVQHEYGNGKSENESKPTFSLLQGDYCNLWNGYICYTIGNLLSNMTYTFKVATQCEEVPVFGEPATVTATIVPQAPSSPVNITGHWDEGYNLILGWMHPSSPNGVITRFKIKIDEASWEHRTTTETSRYNFTINASNRTAQELFIQIRAETDAFSSFPAGITKFSPPKRPTFLTKPRLEDVTRSSFKLILPHVTHVEGSNSIMFVIITDIYQNSSDGDPLHRSFFEMLHIEGGSSWFLEMYNLDNFIPRVIDYDNGKRKLRPFHDDARLPSEILQEGHSYRISIILNNSYAGYSRYTIYSLNFEVDGGDANYLLILLLIPVAVCGIGILLFKKFYHKSERNFLIPRQTDSREITPDHTYDEPRSLPFEMSHAQLYETPPHLEMQGTSIEERGESVPANISANRSNTVLLGNNSAKILNQIRKLSKQKSTKAIDVKDFEDYLREATRSGELERQFKDISSSHTKPWNRGVMSKNKHKNIVPDIAAYDHSRVQLEIVDENPFSDYINANFINGYNSEKAYIATQGPKENTIYDLWRMIWQEKVDNIAVVSEIIENTQRKFEKYWPEINGITNFGDIKVAYIKVQVFANYEIRQFVVSRDNEDRIVRQLYFSCSPHRGIPSYIRCFASFSKKMLDLSSESSPIVVHGSEGFGRTAILILVDICLRMALAEGKVDIFQHLHKLREQRAYMVENVEQYKTVHFILLQILQCISAPSKTGIVCSRTMKYEVDDVIATKLDGQLKFLDDSAWQYEAMRTIDWNVNHPIINPKKPFLSKLRDDLSQASFYPYPSEDSSQIYIRAEAVDCLSASSRFIVTQNPSVHTLGVFWQLVIEKQIKAIVCLNKLNPMDKATCMFYPTSNGCSFTPSPNLKVKFTSKNGIGNCDIYNLTATNSYQQKTPIVVIQLNDWHQTSLHPNTPSCLISAYEIMNSLGKSSSTILITCHDGIRASGLYVAVCHLFEKIKLNHVCDVCLAVQTVRQSRREFVRPPEQFQFLYECGYEYVRQFETYANFGPGSD